MNDNHIDIFGENYYGSYKSTRYACRGIVIQDGNILLSYETKVDQWMIPGGGRENNESDADCVTRELAEETGYIVTPEKQAVTVIEYYEDVRYISVYFICRIAGETAVQLTEAEKENGLERRWVPFKDALSTFSEHERYRDIREEKRGAYLREYSAIIKMMENKDISL